MEGPLKDVSHMTIHVREAILDRFRSLPGSPPLRDAHPSYTQTPSENLLKGLREEVLDDFSAGDGGELEGDPPKFCAVHSSSALAANAFGPFGLHPERLSLAGLSGFTETKFEKKLPTGLQGIPPNLDFFASGPEGTVAVESKFTEVLGKKTAKFRTSYSEAIERLAEPAWSDVYQSLVRDPTRFTHLDAAQLVKHYLGMRNSLVEHSRPQALVYVFWEPRNLSTTMGHSSGLIREQSPVWWGSGWAG